LEEHITIELFGQPYTFKADAKVNQAKAVAEVLMKEVQRIQRQNAGQPAHHSKLTILMSAALNIANDNYELKQQYREAVENISNRSERLLHLLDEVEQ
jgi:hypothetical protein